MSFLLYMLAGVFAGLLGGMGMGGGTILIPALTIFLGVPQHVAQATNLIAFLPMAAFSLSVHQRQGLLKTEGIGYVIIPAVISSVIGGFAALLLPAEILGKLFGIFLIALSVKQVTELKLSFRK